jgi:hypothetical protein
MAGNNKMVSKTCGRCNNTTTRKITIKDYIPNLNTDGWITVEGILLCPVCRMQYLEMFEKFRRNDKK